MYPIRKLDRNITHILHDIISADIEGNINQGLVNEVSFIDEDSHISCVAEIVKSPLDGKCRVKLSEAFCQFFWLMSDICLKEIDLSIIQEECNKIGADLNSYKHEIEKILRQPMQYIIIMMRQYPGISPMQYLDYLQRSLQLLDEKQFIEGLKAEIQMAASILDTGVSIDKSAIWGLNIDGFYEQKVNSVYCFGIAFILLHELSHFALGHIDKPDEQIEDEENADFAAFWSIYSDISDNRRFSANCGILCMMFSLLMMNKDLSVDGIHPREDKRIFAIYDQIKNENPKYTVLLCRLFRIWAILNEVKDYPTGLSDDEKSLDIIRGFIEEIS